MAHLVGGTKVQLHDYFSGIDRDQQAAGIVIRETQQLLLQFDRVDRPSLPGSPVTVRTVRPGIPTRP